MHWANVQAKTNRHRKTQFLSKSCFDSIFSPKLPPNPFSEHNIQNDMQYTLVKHETKVKSMAKKWPVMH